MRIGVLVWLFWMQVLHCSTEFSLTNFKKDWVSCYKKLISQTGLNVFVESGTYLGHTARKAAGCFQEVHTVELNEEFYEQSVLSLKMYSNVTVYHGNTIDHFPKILLDLETKNKKALFWLDGHYMSSMQDENIQPEAEYTPIMRELSIICKQCSDPVILIDDIRLFGTKLYGERIKDAGNEAYPLLETVYAFLVEQGLIFHIVGDILIAHKAEKKADKQLSVSSLIEACTISRIYDGNNYPIETILDAEHALSRAIGPEREALINFYKEYSMPWRGWRNRSPHYNLWYGLLLQHENHHEEAIEQFEEVLNLGMTHWRVYWYLLKSLLMLGRVIDAQKIL
ncbi:hypothetical protein ACFLYU_00240 [Candidatus Dependentiae bacterium]